MRIELPSKIARLIKVFMIGLKYLVKPNRFTLRYPEEYTVVSDRYRGMIVIDRSKCIGCSSCARICPARAMKMVRVEGEKKLKPLIDYRRCIGCGFCVDVCPVEALRHTRVYDVGYYKLEDMILTLEDFEKEPESPAEAEGGVPVKYVFDEEKGLVKVRGDAGG